MTVRVTHFMRKPRANVFSIERLYEDIRSSAPRDVNLAVWTCRHESKGLWPRLRDAWSARNAQGDVNHVTGDTHYLTYFLDRKRTVLTIHDLVSLARLTGLKRWVFWLLWYWLPVKRSRLVVTISESTKAQLLQTVRCNPGKVRVIHNPVSVEFQPAAKPFNSACPRILQIGTDANKNIERVAEALAGLHCTLVVIGKLKAVQLTALQHHGIAVENHVGLSRRALLAQYVACDLLLFVSTYEGFGLPIVEAHAVGRVVVTSRVSSMPEVAGAGACLVDPYQVDEIRKGVLKVIGDAEYRNHLIEAGLANVERFRVDLVAANYAALYREIGLQDPVVQERH